MGQHPKGLTDCQEATNMDNLTASKVQVGDTVLIKSKKYQATTVLGITWDKHDGSLTFRCTDGTYCSDDLFNQMSHEELEKRFIADKDTRVFINHNDETGEWLYSVQVVDSDGYWLNSFVTEQEAIQYIEKNGLQMC